MAIAMGNIAISKLYARAAEKVVDQSLLNLVKNACKGLTSLSTVCTTSGDLDCFALVCHSFVVVAIVFLPHRRFLFNEYTSLAAVDPRLNTIFPCPFFASSRTSDL